MKVYLNKLILF